MSDTFGVADSSNRIANLIRLGTVAEVSSDRPAKVRVEIEDGWVSDFLPAMQLAAGRVRTWSAPIEGEQVVVLSPSGELAAGIALRGLPYGEFQAEDDAEDVTVVGAWSDGSVDLYDEATHTRELTLVAGGRLKATIGGMVAEFAQDKISLKVGTAEVLIANGAITFTGDVFLGGAGGKAIARHDDPVVSNKIVATSTKVKAG